MKSADWKLKRTWRGGESITGLVAREVARLGGAAEEERVVRAMAAALAELTVVMAMIAEAKGAARIAGCIISAKLVSLEAKLRGLVDEVEAAAERRGEKIAKLKS